VADRLDRSHVARHVWLAQPRVGSVSQDPAKKVELSSRLEAVADIHGKASPIKIELDERCVLFPDGKLVSHLLVAAAGKVVSINAAYQFNESRRSPLVIELSISDARGFTRELVNAAYYAKPCFFISDALQVTINVAQHGLHIEFLRANGKVELLVSVPATWRLIKGLLSAVDACSPIASH
jgi:hypothetical protein